MFSRWAAWIAGGVLIILGLLLLGGGGWLAALGGSLYYLLAGVACALAGIAILRGRSVGIVIYAALLLVTVLWALWEVGFSFWLLVPRLAGPLAIGVVLAIPWVQRRLARSPSSAALWSAPIAAAVAATTLVGAYSASGVTLGDRVVADSATPSTLTPGAPDEWTAFGRTVAGTRYSPAAQITPANVGGLEQAWVYRTGDMAANFPETKAKFQFQVTPIQVDGNLYFCTPRSNIVALQGETGKQIWRFDPKITLGDVRQLTCRGVSYHRSPTLTGACATRILVATVDGRLIAVDAKDGKPCADFGDDGTVSLRDGLGEVTPAGSYTTSPPTIIGDVAVLGSYVRDNDRVDDPSGVVRAFDVHDGRLLWAWDAARPEDAPPRQPGENYTPGSPNAWTVFSADPALGLVYIPTGNAAPDHVGFLRTPAEEKYSSSIVALDVATGKVRWHFQTTHHDLWDYDIPSQPVLFDLPAGGRTVSALAAPTKRGEIFILDRRTGKALTQVTDRPAPRGAVPGERYSPTQPYSTGFPSLAPTELTEKAMWGATPFDQLWCRIWFRQLDYAGNFTPPSVRGSLQYPGLLGALNWGSVSVDEGRRIMVVNSTALPEVVHLIPRAKVSGSGAGEMHAGFAPQTGTPYGLTLNVMLTPLGLPCKGPPWGELTAIDLQSRKILWRRPFGTSSDSAPLGIAIPGIFNLGGSAVTKSGVIFIGATLDNYLRAFDVNSGKELWRGRLPAGGQASPMTFTSKRDGRQYVVIAAGGHGFLGTTLGDHVVAFALPKQAKAR